ncbi:MAG: type I methionyl aminopeptidase [Patescibacteria group bacterium]
MTKLTIKTEKEIAIMAEGGAKLAEIRDKVARAVKPGVSAIELDKLADKLIAQAGGKPSFKMVPGYRWATCININDVVVHGIPDSYRIKAGDKVGIDVGIFYKGWHTDTSITVGGPEKFLEVGRMGLKRAIAQARMGKRVADISAAMQKTVEMAKYNVVRALTGHGVGRKLHEEPAIPCFVIDKYEHSPKLLEGMIIAIEIMYNAGSAEVVYKNNDGWTIVTADGKISGLFEETVAITSHGPIVLTCQTH